MMKIFLLLLAALFVKLSFADDFMLQSVPKLEMMTDQADSCVADIKVYLAFADDPELALLQLDKVIKCIKKHKQNVNWVSDKFLSDLDKYTKIKHTHDDAYSIGRAKDILGRFIKDTSYINAFIESAKN